MAETYSNLYVEFKFYNFFVYYYRDNRNFICWVILDKHQIIFDDLLV